MTMRSLLKGLLSTIGFLLFSQSLVAEEILYLGDQDTANQLEVYLVDSDQPGQTTKINSTLTQGANGLNYFFLSFDATTVLYAADQDTVGVSDLYTVNLNQPGVSTKMNPTLVNGGNVQEAFFSFDSTSIFYRADQDTDDTFELYQVALNSAGNATKLNGAIANGSPGVDQFLVTPDQSKVVYTAPNASNVLEFFVVDVQNPGIATNLNVPMQAGDSITNLEISADSQRVGYVRDRGFGQTQNLFSVELDTPGVVTQLNSNLPGGGQVTSFEFHENNSDVVYTAQDSFGMPTNLFLTNFSNPGSATQLNPGSGPLLGGIFFLISPDGNNVIYISTEGMSLVTELFSVPLANPGNATKLSGTVAMGATGATVFQQSRDNSMVVYTAGHNGTTTNDLFRVNTSQPGSPVQLNPMFTPNEGVAGYRISPNNTSVAYSSNEDNANNIVELFFVALSNPGTSTKLSRTFPAGAIGSLLMQYVAVFDPNGGGGGGGGPGGGGNNDPEPTTTLIDDISNNGIPELVTFWPQSEGGEAGTASPKNSAATLQINDSSSGGNLGTLSFFNTDWTAEAVIGIPGLANNGGPGVGLLATRTADGFPGIQIKDPRDGTLIRNVFPLSANWTILGVEVVQGLAGGPALAVLATRKSDGLMAVQVRDAATNGLLRNIYHLGFGWTPQAQKVLSVQGAPAIGVLATRDADGLTIVQVRDANTGNLIRNVYHLGFGWSPVEMTVVPDISGNNADEVALRMTRDADGLEIIQIRDAATQALVSNVYPIGAGLGPWTTQAFRAFDNNGTIVLGILSTRNSDGTMLVQVRNANTAALLNNTFFIGPPWEFRNGYEVVSDYTGNNVPELAVATQNSVNGSRLVQVRDAVTAQVLRNIPIN
ncbi:MAG: hypothetical protein AAF438_13110 [Pseudomonadota bacterium]